jgi:integrase
VTGQFTPYMELNGPLHALHAKRTQYLPALLSREVVRVLENMQGLPQLMARLPYGCGLLLMECLRLRCKDNDFEQNQIILRQGRGEKDSVTLLPASLSASLKD